MEQVMSMHKEIKLSRMIKYGLGMVAIAFGVAMMLKSGVGVSSWDTLHYSINQLSENGKIWTGITVGDATIIVALIFTFLVSVLNWSKDNTIFTNLRYIFMAIPIFTVGYLIDVFNLQLLAGLTVSNVILKALTYMVGLLLLPLGGALLISSTYPAGVFDEFMLAIMRKLKSDKMIRIRVIMELTAVLTAFIFGQIAGIGFGQIGIGTIIFSISTGIMIKTYLKLFERIGLIEN
jgi:uncharacterized membrane protein YczE